MAKVITSLRDSPSAKRVLLDIITLLSSLLSLEEGCPIMVVSHTVHTKLQRQWQRKFFHHLSLLFSYVPLPGNVKSPIWKKCNDLLSDPFSTNLCSFSPTDYPRYAS